MVVVQEYKNIIEKMVTSNKRFSGNEDLFEDFCAEAMERCCFLLKKTDEITKIENYLNKLTSNAMISVLKTSGRITRSADGYKNIAQITVPLENPLDDGILDIKDTTINFVEKISEQETLQEIYNLVLKFNEEEPQEYYSKIFYMKYVQGRKQREIAQTLKI
ncbi:MAG: hypothetical protein MJ180_01930, partial [Candidatus Gastranaerophilales bacterium]|nr:hypothetical protein [Candidatus Gastranaerophilales bacterium]